MRYLFVFIFSFNSLLYSQKREKTDSLSYYNTLINYNINIDKYDEALINSQKAIDYCIANNKKEDQVQATLNLGKIYYELKKNDAAIQNFFKSISLYDSVHPNLTIASAYHYLGLANVKKGNYSSANIYFDKSDSINNKFNIIDLSGQLNLQKGIAFKSAKKYDLAIDVFKKITQKTDHRYSTNTKAEAYYQLALIQNHFKRNDLSVYYLENAFELNAKKTDLEQKAKIILALSKNYTEIEDFDRAYSYLDEYYQLKDRILKMHNAKLSFEDYTKFKENSKAREDQRIINYEAQKKAYKYSKLINILSVALIAILSLLCFSLYKINIIRNNANLLLTDKNSELELAKNKAEKASKARSEFLSTVSHELRTPLNAINGITHLLIEENPKKSQTNYLSSLKFSGEYLTAFINDILEINKIESDKVEIEHANFNLKELLQNIQNSLKELATANNNSLKLKIDPIIPDNLIGDPTKLSQVFLNLINNALKFTENGDVCINAKLHSIQDGTASIYFEVADTGIGIPEDKLESVFDSFSQGSIEINRKYGGTGLGLTIIKKIIKILGGKIEVTSEVGKGSCFSFELNFKINSMPITSEIKTKVLDETIFNNKKILLVEDNKINQMISKKMLESKGAHCSIIDNGEEAIDIVKENTFDLILMDIHLLGINGTDATKYIREFDTFTPIIALTAISLNENREMLISYGMNDVITKPFIPRDFYEIIAQYL